jgi:hypothetical protein
VTAECRAAVGVLWQNKYSQSIFEYVVGYKFVMGIPTLASSANMAFALKTFWEAEDWGDLR